MQQGQNFGAKIEDLANSLVIGGLTQARTEIQEQVTRLEARRQALQSAVASAPNRAARLRIQNDLGRVEAELSEMRSALDKVDRQLTGRDAPRGDAYARAVVAPQPPLPPPSDFNPAPMIIAVVSIVLIGFPIALTIARFIWKRSTHAPAPPMTAAQTQRFDRLEQSVDAIAIEVERISENQRYLTKLLAEPKKQGLGVGQ